jgi:murein DD-endopeptidase
MREFRHASLFQSKLQNASQVEKYRLYALTYAEAPYGWGDENLQSTDCSGLLCGPLLFMGFNIRVNANDLMNKLFTDEMVDSDHINAVFFVDKGGVARHCGLFVSDNVVMHASGERGVTFDGVRDILSEYDSRGYYPVFRAIDWAKAYELDGTAYDVDEEMI